MKRSSEKMLLLSLAFGSAFGIPRGYRAKWNSKPQSSSDRVEQIDAANAKRNRKNAKRAARVKGQV